MVDTPAFHDLVNDEYGLFIGGEYVDARSGSTVAVEDPGTETPFTTAADAKSEDVDRAVEDSRAAFDEWSSYAPDERGELLRAVGEAIENHAEEIGTLLALENGKPFAQAKGETMGGARYFEYYGGFADKIHGSSIPLTDDKVDYTVREPLGVTAQIIPWNGPLDVFCRSVAPALAAGNTAVVKPAEQTPLSGVKLGEIAVEAGLPPGVLNVIPGFGEEAGAPLASHPEVDGVSFTGSTEAGREVSKLAVDNLTHVHTELGGKNPAVVYPDANLDDVVSDILMAIFTVGTGQGCSATDRLVLHSDVYDEVLDRLVDRIADITIGHSMDDPDMGPLAHEEQYEKVLRYLDIGRKEAGDPVVGGETLDRKGYFVEPTIFEATNDARIAQKEIFGPVLTVIEFEDEAEAIRIANGTQYGLVGGIYTQDIGRAYRFAREVDAGQIYINEWWPSGVETPFGGYKQSGIGREKGLEAINEFTQVKNVCASLAGEGGTGMPSQ